MITKNDLRIFRARKLEIKLLQDQIEELRLSLEAPGTTNFSGMPSCHGDPDKLSNALYRLANLRDVYYEKMGESLEQQVIIEAAIDTLEPVDRNIVRLHYFMGMTWEATADELHYSKEGILKRHGKLLQLL